MHHRAASLVLGHVATALAFDKGMEHRIDKHKEQRPDYWDLIETYKEFDKMGTIINVSTC